ncbi:MAG: nuclear transport factor 2 family protein [Actinobacteria bacterium]|nr:MAG: nuclear transport factor 2 family protein [Actinomycetota bacterium]
MSTTIAADQRSPSPPSAEAWVAGFVEGWRAPTGPDAFAAHFRPMLAPDVRLIQPRLPDVTGPQAFEDEFVRPLFRLIPDLRGEVERWAAQGEVLYIELTLRGTLGGQPVSWRVCDRVTLRDGLAVERESYFDPVPLLAAVAARPRAWLPFVRLQARRLANQLSTRRKP